MILGTARSEKTRASASLVTCAVILLMILVGSAAARCGDLEVAPWDGWLQYLNPETIHNLGTTTSGIPVLRLMNQVIDLRFNLVGPDGEVQSDANGCVAFLKLMDDDLCDVDTSRSWEFAHYIKMWKRFSVTELLELGCHGYLGIPMSPLFRGVYMLYLWAHSSTEEQPLRRVLFQTFDSEAVLLSTSIEPSGEAFSIAPLAGQADVVLPSKDRSGLAPPGVDVVIQHGDTVTVLYRVVNAFGWAVDTIECAFGLVTLTEDPDIIRIPGVIEAFVITESTTAAALRNDYGVDVPSGIDGQVMLHGLSLSDLPPGSYALYIWPHTVFGEPSLCRRIIHVLPGSAAER